MVSHATADAVRRLILEELAPHQGIRGTIIATFPELGSDAAATPADVGAVFAEAAAHGEAPVGALEFSTDTLEFGMRQDVPVGTIVTSRDGVVTRRRVLAFGAGGTIGIGAQDYDSAGHLLPDVETGMAELARYAQGRARQLAYAGSAHVEIDLFPSEQGLLLFTLDPESGERVQGAANADLTGFSYDYSLAASAEDQQAALYVAATRLARAFGVDEPQWFRAPVDAAPLEGRTPVSPGA